MTGMPKVKTPIPSQDKKLLEWSSERVSQCQRHKFYGKMTIHFEGGKITRTTTESSEVPKI